MAIEKNHAAIVDQLQAQVNLVLEQTGRFFAATSANPKEIPTAQVSKLKHIVPMATNRFHDALDELHSEIQMAQLVMRRDLALCRERNGQQTRLATGTQEAQAAAPESRPQPTTEPIQPATAKQTTETASVNAPTTSADQDTVMQEDEDQEPAVPEVPMEDVKMTDLPAVSLPANGDIKMAPSQVAHTQLLVASDSAPSANDLQIDTKPAPQDVVTKDKPAEDEKPPDTAIGSTVGDLDSLFNDGGNDNASITNDFNFDTGNHNDEIDFGDFGSNFNIDNNDNDNISSLLPGLEDYANNQSGAGNPADFDLNTFLDTGDGHQNNDGMNNQGSGEPRDTTFDDLLDMANFDGAGMDGDGNNNPPDLDFDSLFN